MIRWDIELESALPHDRGRDTSRISSKKLFAHSPAIVEIVDVIPEATCYRRLGLASTTWPAIETWWCCRYYNIDSVKV